MQDGYCGIIALEVMASHQSNGGEAAQPLLVWGGWGDLPEPCAAGHAQAVGQLTLLCSHQPAAVSYAPR